MLKSVRVEPESKSGLNAGEFKPVKYMFLFIADGVSYPQREMAERYRKAVGGEPLFINHLPHNCGTRTCCANNVTTDSAAAGTAIACGEKTNKGSLGVDAKGARLESVAEAAKKKGYKIGILSSVHINNATPAAFYGHQDSRGEAYALGVDLIKSGFDFFAGGYVADDQPSDKARPENVAALEQEVADLWDWPAAI